MRFHVLGIGSIGTLVAHNLRLAQPSAQVCLVVRNGDVFRKRRLLNAGGTSNLLEDSERDTAQGPTLRVARVGADTIDTSGYELDVSRPTKLPLLREAIEQGSLKAVNPSGPIESLIVCTKAPMTSQAIQGLRDRISPNSVITLLQNGMGVYDELCAKFWPDAASRPQFILGTTTHGVSPVAPGSVIHATRVGEGAVKFGVVPDPRGADVENWLWGHQVSHLPPLTPPDSPRLPLPAAPPGLENVHATLEALLSMSPLIPSLLPMPHLYHELLLKLAVNATVNPLTAVLGGGYLHNGALRRSGPGNRLIKQTADETSAILTAYLHSLSPQGAQPDTVRLFSGHNLRERINNVISQTAQNFSSMSMDVKNGRMTEIDYINGFLVMLGERLKVPAPLNRTLVQMVKFKAEMGGLGDTVKPEVRSHIRTAESEATEIRKISLEERRLALAEREMLIRETRTSEAKRAQRSLKREVKKRERRQEWLARKEREGSVGSASASVSASASGSESESSTTGSDGLKPPSDR